MRTQRRRRSISDFQYLPLVAALGAALTPVASHAETVTVSNTSDTLDMYGGAPPNSLRAAIEHFNVADGLGNLVNCTGGDVINFDFPNGPFISSLSAPLPAIQCGGLTIDGGSRQYDSPAKTQIFGGSSSASFGLFAISDTFVTVTGLEVAGFTYGTALAGSINADNNIVHDNIIGIAGFTNSTIRDNRVFSNSAGIRVAYGGELVERNVVYANSSGIEVEGAANGDVNANYLGIDDGTRPDLSPAGNVYGLYVNQSAISAKTNTISSNDFGVYLNSDLGSLVDNNNIGTDRNGTGPAGNWTGIYAGGSATGTVISTNVIAASSTRGIDLNRVSGLQVNGNFIGTDRTATATNLLNNSGISALCGSAIEIRDNFVAAAYGGRAITFDAITGGGKMNIVGNKIGVKGDGVSPLGNNSYGVTLRNSNCIVGAALAKATAPAGATDGIVIDNNTIANGSADGILLAGAINTTISHNTIVSNGGYGVNMTGSPATFSNKIVDNPAIAGNATTISLGPKNVNLAFSGGSLPNDGLDGDTTDANSVPNNGQNYPVVDSAVRDAATNQTVVSFTLDTQPGNYRIDIYGNTAATTVPGGDQLLGTIGTFSVATAGPTTGSFIVTGVSADNISLLATNLASNDTSEFSLVKVVTNAPDVSVSATSVDFGNVPLNSDSTPRSVVISSTGSASYQLGAFGDTTCYGGAICGSGAFTCTTTCSTTSYAPGTSCQITATFHPIVTGSDSRTIAICDNVSPGTRTITLTGNGVPQPPITVAPSAWDFGSTLIGARSASNTFTITNPGSAEVSLTVPTTTPTDFAVDATDCGATLPATGVCHAQVSFAPSVAGPITGAFSVTSNTAMAALSKRGARYAKAASGSSASAALSGTGVAPQAVLSLPSSIDFGDYTSGAAALHSVVTLLNNGNGPLTFSNISATGPFPLTNTCPASLAPGASCTVTLDFSTPGLGSYTGTFTVVSNSAGGSATIPVTARTVAAPAPRITVTPTSIGFGDRLVGTLSSSQRVTITNDGSAAAALSAPVTNAADFLVTATTCGASLAPAQSCSADVGFQPTALGPRSGQLVVASNDAASPDTVDLSGNGILAPAIVISPGSMDFGSVLLGARSAAANFIIFNPGTSPVLLGTVTTSADFVLESSDCGSTLAALSRCTASVSFAPSRPGVITGSLSLATSAALASSRGGKLVTTAPSASASLSGTGVIQSSFELPASIDFGDYTAGAPALRRTATLTNTGNAVLSFSNISVTGVFTLTNGCPLNLAPGASCTLTLDYSAAALGAHTGTVVVTSNSSGGQRTIALSARTVATPVPHIRVAPLSLSFGDRLLGTQTASQRVTITNDGSAAAILSAPVVTNTDFLVVGTTCGVSLAPAQTCFADVVLRPVGYGPRAAQLVIGSNSAGSPVNVLLQGTGCRPFSIAASYLGGSSSCSQ